MGRALLLFSICVVFANAASVSYQSDRGHIAAGGDTPRFVVAYYQPMGSGESVLTLLPFAPVKAFDSISLPHGMSSRLLISFGPDGKSMYFTGPPDEVTYGVTRIDFSPVRESIVPGSGGLSVGFLTVSPSGRIFVSAEDLRDHGCGAYEIDTSATIHRPIRVGVPPDCAGALGEISPDGKRLLSSHSQPRMPGSPPAIEYVSLLDLETGAIQTLGEGRGRWSPDGRWIAVAGHGRIVLIDPSNPSHRKKLGASGVDNTVIWSPDSKRLVFARQELRCFLMDDLESLEVVDVETGKRHAIQSAHCAVTSATVGWIDPAAVR